VIGLVAPAATVNAKDNSEGFIYLKVGRDMKKVFLNDIVYVEGWKDYVKVFLANDKVLLVRQSISATENLLSDHMFLRIHRSFMVSLDKVTGYNGFSVQLETKEIPIGRLYKQIVLEKLQAH